MEMRKLLGFAGMILFLSLLTMPLNAQNKEQKLKAEKSKVKVEQTKKELNEKATKIERASKEQKRELKDKSHKNKQEKLELKEKAPRKGDDASDADESEGKGINKKQKVHPKGSGKSQAHSKHKGDVNAKELSQKTPVKTPAQNADRKVKAKEKE